ncbi:MAG: metallophosphoesterase [Muribaculaceae bacterium]|nr:metallophosphoesterase [Muribaculaceae bacterium]
MRIFYIPLVLALLLIIAIDWLIYRKLKKSQRWKKGWRRAHVATALPLTAGMICLPFIPHGSASNQVLTFIMWFLFIFYSFVTIKFVAFAIYSLSWVKSLPEWGKKFVRFAAIATAAILAVIVFFAVAVTPYRYEVNRVTIEFENLPKAFDGYTIAQFSDSHLGTYGDDTTFVAKYTQAINDLKPDMICFTGDLVNRRTEEARPFVPQLKRLHAPDGVLAILGNHDYDDYSDWDTEKLKLADQQALRRLEEECGWTLVDNRHLFIRHGSDSIAIIGTGNYGGSSKNNPTYGKLESSYPNLNDSCFKILLQHNPEVWSQIVVGKTNVDLTLAGHTHAMQIMFKVFGLRLSPARLKFKHWGGLYNEGKQQLYVNIGMGMVGIPMRAGATPEITLITLKRK